MYCKNENSCAKCNDEFTLVKGECLPLEGYEDNPKYYSPDNGISYYTCSSKINGCEECSYNDFSFNKFHCTKCSNGLRLSVTYSCVEIISNNGLTRHSEDVSQRKRIYIEGHRGVSEGQKNHNTKEAILNAINEGIESVEIDVWLTADDQLAVFHDLGSKIYDCKDEKMNKKVTTLSLICPLTYSELQQCETKVGKNKIPLLEDIIKITKGKIFLNLEIKGIREGTWDKIEELIEIYEY